MSGRVIHSARTKALDIGYECTAGCTRVIWFIFAVSGRNKFYEGKKYVVLKPAG